jgi:hypothetical protein
VEEAGRGPRLVLSALPSVRVAVEGEQEDEADEDREDRPGDREGAGGVLGLAEPAVLGASTAEQQEQADRERVRRQQQHDHDREVHAGI